eukprot:617835-Rhodomonas_salina.2
MPVITPPQTAALRIREQNSKERENGPHHFPTKIHPSCPSSCTEALQTGPPTSGSLRQTHMPELHRTPTSAFSFMRALALNVTDRGANSLQQRSQIPPQLLLWNSQTLAKNKCICKESDVTIDTCQAEHGGRERHHAPASNTTCRHCWVAVSSTAAVD